MSLPVEEVLPQLCNALSRGHVVLSSPPGSGKTTRVPLALLEESWLGGKKIIMLEPRRPAARMAAAFMSDLLHEEVGQTVGYQVRMERRINPNTRIEVLTEGLLVRRLQHDPELSGIGLVIFDEFHERSLQADLGLALCLDVCASLREDLRLLVMSATLDEQAVAEHIGGEAIISHGGLHPVMIEHLPRSAGQDILPATARLVHRAIKERPGDVLVFLPGKGEMARLQESLSGSGSEMEILQFHGEMDAATQSRVLRPKPDHPRRVVLATDVAETSLTIEGISTVVDSGLSRKPVFDPDSGLSRLKLLPIAQASATQRTGRAGRLGPGVCYRAFTEQEFLGRPAQWPAEILQLDLAPLVLELALWGVNDPAGLVWLDMPPAAAWNQAVSLLRQLDALDTNGGITAHGRRLAHLGLHPRLAHLLVCGGGTVLAADLAALLSERDPWRYQEETPRPVDLDLRLLALKTLRRGGKLRAGVDPRACRQILRLSERLQRQCKGLPVVKDELSPAALLSLAFPERIAKKRPGADGRYLMASGKGAVLPRDDGLAVAEYLAIAQMDAGSREGRIWLALCLDEQELMAAHHAHVQEEVKLVWDEEAARVRVRAVTALGAIVLSAQEAPPGDDQAVTARLLQAVSELGLDCCLNWSVEARQLQARLRLVHQLDTQGDWPDVGETWLREHLDIWLLPWAAGLRSLKELHRIDLQSVLQGLLTWEQRQRLDELLPGRWKLGDGSTAAIDYRLSPPVLAVPLQLMFGVAQTPAVFHCRQPLVLHLLSPAGRPLQVTTDLAAFWSDAWEQVKKEMRGRYPKHHWPDDPANARPIRLKRQL